VLLLQVNTVIRLHYLLRIMTTECLQ